jgi:hypothetical protein
MMRTKRLLLQIVRLLFCWVYVAGKGGGSLVPEENEEPEDNEDIEDEDWGEEED